MATLDAYKQLTLAELAKRRDPDGNLAVVAEVLSENNEWLRDAIWLEANNVFSHKITRRLSLPEGGWRKINDGVALEASKTVEVMETIGMLETYTQVDKELVLASAHPSAFRMQEAVALLEGLSQTLSYCFVYGDASIDTEQYTGLAPRLKDLSSKYVVSEDASENLTSVYVVQWGEIRTHMVYPKGSKAGLQHLDLGEQTVEGQTPGTYFQAYRDHFQVKAGLAVRDPRCIARYCNIASSGSSNTFNENRLISLLNEMPNGGAGAVIYCNSSIKTQMEIALKDRANVNFSTTEGLGGVPVLRFRGVPVRMVDQISNDETAVS